VDFPYTHNISTLLESCSDHADWPLGLRQAEELTDDAVTTRYPGEAAQVSDTEACRAIELAQQVSVQVQASLRELDIENT
jgi:HEPN domain-containing protein